MTEISESGQINEDEEIIELTDVVKITPEEPEDNEEIIELTDVVEEQPQANEEVTELASIDAEITEFDKTSDSALDDEEITIALADTSVKEPEEKESVDLDEALSLDYAIDEDMEKMEQDEDNFVDSLGMDLEEVTEISEEPEVVKADQEKAVGPGPVSLSSEQVEEALERVIKNMFSEKIDRMLSEIIEKEVTKEIERIKSILLEDAADDE